VVYSYGVSAAIRVFKENPFVDIGPSDEGVGQGFLGEGDIATLNGVGLGSAEVERKEAIDRSLMEDRVQLNSVSDEYFTMKGKLSISLLKVKYES